MGTCKITAAQGIVDLTKIVGGVQIHAIGIII